jgi:hypothetical protein
LVSIASLYFSPQGAGNYTHTRLNDLIKLVKEFDDFTEDNDPHHEHDMGKIEFNGESYFFKIDYYDNQLEYGSEFPEDESITRRVITVMETDEY